MPAILSIRSPSLTCSLVSDGFVCLLRFYCFVGIVNTFPDNSPSSSTSSEISPFLRPNSVFPLQTSTLLITDETAAKIYKLTDFKQITTFLGEDTNTSKDNSSVSIVDEPISPSENQLIGPTSITIDAGNHVYCLEKGANRIRRITPAGTL